MPCYDGLSALYREETEPVTLTPAGLKKLFEQTWDRAYEAGADDAESRQMDPANELYEKIFGRKKPF